MKEKGRFGVDMPHLGEKEALPGEEKKTLTREERETPTREREYASAKQNTGFFLRKNNLLQMIDAAKFYLF